MLTERIQKKLQATLECQKLEVLDESFMHASGPGAETHFKLILVSDNFSGMSLVQRHQKIYQILDQELKEGVHALSLHLFTSGEWEKVGKSPKSPDCRGGS